MPFEIPPEKILEELSRRNPYPEVIAETESASKKERVKLKNMGYCVALETLKDILSDHKAQNLEVDKHFLWSAYGISSRDINGYHVRLSHEEFEGFFDWYHTTGTLLACHQGAQKNIIKSKDAEEIAIAIQNHIYSAKD